MSSSGVLTDFTDHLVKIKNSETIQIYSDDEKDIFQYEVKLTPSLRAEVIRDGRNLKGFYSITPEGFVFVGFPAKDESVTSSDNSANARVYVSLIQFTQTLQYDACNVFCLVSFFYFISITYYRITSM